MAKTATFVRDVSAGFLGEARLYEVAYMNRTEYVIVSSTSAYVRETMVFPATADGDVSDWGELGVAYPDGRFEEALANAGLVLS